MPNLSARLAAAALSIVAAAPVALAQEVHAIEAGSDTVQGTTAPEDGTRLLPIRFFEGATVTVDVKADRGSTFHPKVVLYGTDRMPDGTAVFTVASKGARATLKNFVAKGTGLHWIEISAADGTTGAWTLKTKIRYPRGVTGSGVLGNDGIPVDFTFNAPGRATATITVAGTPKENGAPSFAGLREVGGTLVDPGVVKPGRAGFTLKGASLARQGRYALSIQPPAPGGSFAAKVAWKVASAARRTLAAADVIADPILLGLDPSAGDVTQVLAMHLGVDFARPGATVEFHFGSSVITVPSGALTHAAREVQFTLNLATFGPGTYDVSLTNPDGGTSALEGALSVSAVSPLPVSVSPAYGYEGQVVRLRISGSLIQGNATAAIRKGATTLQGSVAGFGAGFIDADFDIHGAALGAWDVLVTNPGAPAAVLPGAFEVLKVITLDSMTPADNSGGPSVSAVILGGGFVDGAAARLSREIAGGGTLEIEGTSVVTISPAEIRCAFDTTDAEPAFWDLVLSFPTGVVRTLPRVFRTRSTGGAPTTSQPFSATAAADGPPALAYNTNTGEFMAAWVEENSNGIILVWDLFAALIDADGNLLSKPVKVSDDGGPLEKRYAAAGYDSVNDEYLVSWTEKANVFPIQNSQTHPNGKGPVSLFQVMVQRLSPKDLSKVKSNVVVTDQTGYTRGTKDTWYVSDFNSYRPSIAFDAGNKRWEIAWMEEFDTSGLYSGDDYDVFQRSFDPAAMSLGKLSTVAVTGAHEGDPVLAYDSKGGRILRVHNARSSTKGGDLDLYAGTGASGSLLLAGNGDDLGDPQVAVDDASGNAVVTWTRVTASGTRSVEAASVALASPSTILGSPVSVASGGTDLLARPVANPSLMEVHIVWTRQDGKGLLSVLRRSADPSSSKGLSLVGDEIEVSSGGGDEACATAVYAPLTGETAVLWLGKITITGNTTYGGDTLFKGTMRGQDFWFQRIQ